jgi:uroporphyrin-III C-methyltransferase/precorrin-2 dehydrogenase/sirohydrochlorin ferrochelatase
MHSLPVFLSLKGRPVVLAGNGGAIEAKRRLLERCGARIVGPDEPAQLGIVVYDDPAEAEAMTAELKARGLLLNVPDRPDLCDFTLPAIIDRDPVLIAIGTGGASAGLAKMLRQRIERLLPATLGSLAEALAAARAAMRARWPDARDRRGALDRALGEGGALDPLSGADSAAVQRWLDAAKDVPSARIETITLASTDPDELTLRAARLLGEADLVLHDPAVPAAILDRARADALRRPLGAEDTGQPAAGLTVILRMAQS